MVDQAHVSSLPAIESFRAYLITYVSKTRPDLEAAIDEIFRFRDWLQTNRRRHWEHEVKLRTKAFKEAQETLFSAKLSNLRKPTMAEQSEVVRTKRALDEAEEKLTRVKRWIMDFDQRVQPLVKELEPLRTTLANELPRGVHYLARVIDILQAYAGESLAPGRAFSTPALTTEAAAQAAGSSAEPAAITDEMETAGPAPDPLATDGPVPSQAREPKDPS